MFTNFFFLILPLSMKLSKINSLLSIEFVFLQRLIYRSSNQFKSSLILRKMVQIRRLITKTKFIDDEYSIFKSSKQKSENGVEELYPNISQTINSLKPQIINCCEQLFIVCSTDVSSGFFLPLNFIVMGTVARIHYLVSHLPSSSKAKRHPIDEILD